MFIVYPSSVNRGLSGNVIRHKEYRESQVRVSSRIEKLLQNNCGIVHGVKLEIGKQKLGRDATSFGVGCLQTGRSVSRYGLARVG
jgi:hypothetical protein